MTTPANRDERYNGDNARCKELGMAPQNKRDDMNPRLLAVEFKARLCGGGEATMEKPSPGGRADAAVLLHVPSIESV